MKLKVTYTKIFEKGTVTVYVAKVAKKEGQRVLFLKIVNRNEVYNKIIKYQQRRKIVSEIENAGVVVLSNEIMDIQVKIRMVWEGEEALLIEQAGWQYFGEERLGFATSKVFDLDGIEQTGVCLPYILDEIGVLDKQFFKNYLKKNIKRQIIVCFALSAMLCSYERKTIILSICGDSSTGKTTISELCVSLFGNDKSNMFYHTFNGTKNSLLKDLDRCNGIPVVIDDTSIYDETKEREMSKLIYQLAEGKEKGRMSRNRAKEKRAEWSTAVLLTGEHSILSSLDANKEGAIGRMIEIAVAENDLFDNNAEVNKVKEYMKKNKGNLGNAFVKYVLTNIGMVQMEKDYKNVVNSMQQHVKNKEGIVSRICESIAFICLAGRYLNCIITDCVNVDEMKKYLIETFISGMEDIRIYKKASVVMNEIYPILCQCNDGVAVNGKLIQKNGTKCVFYDKESWKGIMLQINPQFNIKALEIKRVLKSKNKLLVNKAEYEYNLDSKTHGTCVVIDREGA